MLAFRRELYRSSMADQTAATAVRGGDVIFEVDEGLNTLVRFPSYEEILCTKR